MTQPDWAKEQHADERSEFHGRKDKDHGPHERGMGAKEEHPTGKGKPFVDASLDVPAGVSLDASEDQLAGLTTAFPTKTAVPNVPPVLDQGSTPQCVPYSSGYDQNQLDRPEIGKFVNFDEARFFRLIGGTADGSSMTTALAQRITTGIPIYGLSLSSGLYHRIRSDVLLDRTVTAFKSVIVNRRQGVMRIGPWFHSWFHPLDNGKLPAPDYLVGWHATWLCGFDDARGAEIQNSWGTAYGIGGRVFLPYTYLIAAGSMWATTDK